MIDRANLGRRYGPYRYTVGLEEIRDFARVLAGGAPGRVFGVEPPEAPHPWHLDEAAGRASPYGSIVAPTTFVVRFAMQPFSEACSDPALGIDLVRLLHGEQSFEYGDVVRPGDVVATVGEISDLQQRSGMDIMTVKSLSSNQRGKVVVVGTWKAVLRH